MRKGIGQASVFGAVVYFHVIVLGLFSEFQPLNPGGSWVPKAVMLSGYVLNSGETLTSRGVPSHGGDSLKSELQESTNVHSRIDMVPGFGDKSPASSGLRTENYRTSDELHTRASPVEQWNIPRHLLSENPPLSIAFSVWISESGNIDWLEIHTPLTSTAWSTALRAELAKTKMEPATLNDTPVPSTMTVEVDLEQSF